jgi:hypothetical protein
MKRSYERQRDEESKAHVYAKHPKLPAKSGPPVAPRSQTASLRPCIVSVERYAQLQLLDMTTTLASRRSYSRLSWCLSGDGFSATPLNNGEVVSGVPTAVQDVTGRFMQSILSVH